MSLENKESNENERWYSSQINKNQVFKTKIDIKIIGRALVTDLDLCNPSLPGNVSKKHMTLIFRKSPKFTKIEVCIIENLVAKYFKLRSQKNINNDNNLIEFKIKAWGNESCLILGELKEFHQFIIEECIKSNVIAFESKDQRQTHVKLFKGERNNFKVRRNNGRKNDKIEQMNSSKGKEFWYSSQLQPGKEYYTGANIIKCGRALAFDVEDSMLPGNVKGKHCTIFFRSNPKFKSEEIELLNKVKNKWLQNNNKNKLVSFTIVEWGNSSVLIKGNLCLLCEFLREECANMSSDKQRPPHAALFRKSRN